MPAISRHEKAIRSKLELAKQELETAEHDLHKAEVVRASVRQTKVMLENILTEATEATDSKDDTDE